MLMKSAGHDLSNAGIKVLLLHPGWVKTRMGGSSAMIEPAVSIAGMKKVIAHYDPKPGEVIFYRYDGQTHALVACATRAFHVISFDSLVYVVVAVPSG